MNVIMNVIKRRDFITTSLIATTALCFPRFAAWDQQCPPFAGPCPPFGPQPSQQESAMATFRLVAAEATRQGFTGAFPNFYEATYGQNHVGGTTFIKKSLWVEWRDVPLADLRNPSLNDFGGRLRATQEYATRNGFVGGFPNFFHADYGKGIVCGTVLIKPQLAVWQDVPLLQLGANVSLNDIGGRFRGTQDYAKRNAFVGGFPNMFDANYGKGIVCGTILLGQNVAVWQDVPMGTLPN
ncbi:MAG: hypothetical protein ACREDD_03095 [Methylocella sp.]